jgi:hypothetical protein
VRNTWGHRVAHTGLAVAEARWWDSGNDSVRPLFETLAGIVEGNPHSMRYDMFADKPSLSRIVDELTGGDFHSLYVASHGSENSIGGLGDVEISRTELRNILRNSNAQGPIKGLYFGSCLIGTARNASFWLTDGDSTGLQWVAGYTKSVDWIDSSAVDMIFWSKYLHERKINRSRRKGKKSELQMVKAASSDMKNLMPTVFAQLGFNIYHLDTGGALTAVW